MIIPITLLFGALGFFIYNSKDEITLVNEKSINTKSEHNDDDLYKELEDLFI